MPTAIKNLTNRVTQATKRFNYLRVGKWGVIMILQLAKKNARNGKIKNYDYELLISLASLAKFLCLTFPGAKMR